MSRLIRTTTEPARDPDPACSPRVPEPPSLRRAIDELPEPLRRVLLARHRDHLDFDDIAVRLDLTQAEARTLWLRAVERLNRRMDQVP